MNFEGQFQGYSADGAQQNAAPALFFLMKNNTCRLAKGPCAQRKTQRDGLVFTAFV